MKSTGLLSAAALALLLSACADMRGIAPKSNMIDPAKLGAGKAIGQATHAIDWPKQQWWQDLNDPQLNTLVAAALKGSPTLHAAQARVRMANAIAEGAEEHTMPHTDVNMSVNRELYSARGMVPPPLAGTYSWRSEITVGTSYDLDLWGRNRAALAAALDEVELASAESQMARLWLEAAVVKTYIKLSHQFEMKELLEDTLKQRERMLDISRKRLKAGLSNELDVDQFETAIPVTRRQLEQVASAIILLRNELAALQGKGPDAGESIGAPTLKLSRAPALPSALPAELVGRRPDIAAQRWRVEAAAKRIKVSKAEFYPNVNIKAFIGLQAFGLAKFLQSDSQVRGIGPAISLPIFRGAELRAQLGLSTAEYDVAVEQYNATVVGALSDVAGAITSLDSLGKQHALTGESLATATRTSKLAQRAYRAGLTDSINVLTAEVELLSQQQQMASMYAQQLDGYVGLMVALGGGTEIAQIATQPPTI